MNNQKTRDLVYLSLFISIIFVMAWVPFLGFIPLTPVISLTLIHIPVLIAIFFLGRKLGILTGLAFGIMSWILAMVRPIGVLDPFFVNPILSVLPRLLFAVLTVMVYDVFSKLVKNEYLVIIIVSIIGSLIHSVLVLGTLVLLYFPDITTTGTFNAAIIAALTVLGTNSTLEAVTAALIATPIVKALRTISKKEKGNFDL